MLDFDQQANDSQSVHLESSGPAGSLRYRASRSGPPEPPRRWASHTTTCGLCLRSV